MRNPVIVTALYDIGRDNWKNFTMSYHTYGWWMRNTLSFDANIVIYTESKFIEELTNYRKEFDPELKKTIFVETPLNELVAYKKYHDILSKLMTSQEFKKKVSFHDVPEMCQPLYNVIMFNKVFFLKDTIEKRYFDNDVVIWADAGGLRGDVELYSYKKWPSQSKLDKLDSSKITFFSHNQDFGVFDKQFHCLSQVRNIQGTSFILPSKMIDFFTNLVIETIDECISNGYIGSDEKIFDICYTKQKESFFLIKSTWREYFDLMLESDKMKVIVSKYKEDIRWIKNIKYDTIVFNKNIEDNNLFKNNLPNVGREGHTFFNFIVNNYENLPEYMCFLQGNPHDHCHNFIEIINNFDFKKEFLPVGPIFEETTENDAINHQVTSYSKKIGFELKFPIYLVRGAQFIISKNQVLTNPKKHYEKILDSLSHEVNPWAAYDVEKTLFQIFGIYKP